MGEEKEEKKKNPKLLIIILIAIIVILIGVVVAVLVISNNKKSQNSSDATVNVEDESEAILARGFVTEDNAEKIGETMQDKVADGYFNCIMTTEWTFQDGASASQDAYVENSTANHYTLYFDLYDNTTNELLYSSPLIPVGSALSGITLDKDLDAGEYEATAMYTLVDDNYNAVSQCGFVVEITVLQ